MRRRVHAAPPPCVANHAIRATMERVGTGFLSACSRTSVARAPERNWPSTSTKAVAAPERRMPEQAADGVPKSVAPARLPLVQARVTVQLVLVPQQLVPEPVPLRWVPAQQEPLPLRLVPAARMVRSVLEPERPRRAQGRSASAQPEPVVRHVESPPVAARVPVRSWPTLEARANFSRQAALLERDPWLQVPRRPPSCASTHRARVVRFYRCAG